MEIKMLKKVIPIVIALCLILSISAMAENINGENESRAPQVSGQMPADAGARPQGARGPMGAPPEGEFVPPEGGGVPKQDANANSNAENTPQPEDNAAGNPQIPGGNRQFGGQMPGGMGGFPGNMQNFNGQTQEEQPTGFWGFARTYSTPITSVILMALAYIFVIFYRRKNY